jgi:ribosomal protein S18 acetylase RimI-like enzyme
MSFAVRRIGSGDEAVLELLARDESDFDVAGRSAARPLPAEAARDFLADDNVLFWIAEAAGDVIGFLSCQLVRRRADAPELLLYEIGVRQAQRRRGVGRALMAAMDAWMHAHAVAEVWVLADNEDAVTFYRACGFLVAREAPVYLTRG